MPSSRSKFASQAAIALTVALDYATANADQPVGAIGFDGSAAKRHREDVVGSLALSEAR